MEVPGLDAYAKSIYKRGELYIGRVFHEMDDNNGHILIRPFMAGGAVFSIKVMPQNVLWKDADGRINLEFKALGPALQYYCPGQWEDQLYRSEPMWVEGTVNGKKVSGFGVVDMSWGKVGIAFSQSKVYRLLEEYWVVWLNVYEDGSRECGVFIDGVDRFGAYYHNKNGAALVFRQNAMEVRKTADGFIESAIVKADGQTFEYTTESRVLKAPTTWTAWASGRVINLGEKRKPVKSFAWFEFFPKDTHLKGGEK
jgi:hypothetical protein